MKRWCNLCKKFYWSQF